MINLDLGTIRRRIFSFHTTETLAARVREHLEVSHSLILCTHFYAQVDNVSRLTLEIDRLGSVTTKVPSNSQIGNS